MLLKTHLFGEINVEEEEVINFTKPILGFDDCTQYVLVEKESIFPTFWLQSVNNPGLAFPVVSPFSVNEDYSIKLQNHDLDDIRLKDINDILVMTLMVVPQVLSSIRTNLRAPIIYNPVNKVAKQLVLYDDKYPVHYYIMDNTN
ncbi:MAG: Flagellar assembly factor FliW [Candidatus Scalindua arabica]|uniref:Flagellar assembly factor FliW n=1 Tax=Candidatus Scalindua arabica TaxID=1127984 RepID=A0A942A2X0_9BACT|nr:Flagellar assembly factor FliW [Candidatus Scalindua arabica]